MSSMNFTCDVCGREVFSCTFVNGMKFCAKCYQETFGETDKDRKISDLEAKLAESEEKKESYRLQNEHHHLQLLQFYSRLGVEAFGADIHEKALETLMIMKEQLAEKDKEIEQLKKFDDLNKTFFDLFRTAFKEPDNVDDLFNTLKTIQEKQDQDKISFAVEQLEKLKVELHIIHTNGYLKAIDEEIDNQINGLKGEK